MKKIRIVWTCSNWVRHEHRWKWTAAICGWVQSVVFPLIRLRGTRGDPWEGER